MYLYKIRSFLSNVSCCWSRSRWRIFSKTMSTFELCVKVRSSSPYNLWLFCSHCFFRFWWWHFVDFVMIPSFHGWHVGPDSCRWFLGNFIIWCNFFLWFTWFIARKTNKRWPHLIDKYEMMYDVYPEMLSVCSFFWANNWLLYLSLIRWMEALLWGLIGLAVVVGATVCFEVFIKSFKVSGLTLSLFRL